MNNQAFKPNDRVRCSQLPDWYHGVFGLRIQSVVNGMANLQFCSKSYSIDTLTHWNTQNEETKKSTIGINRSLNSPQPAQTKHELSEDAQAIWSNQQNLELGRTAK